MPVYSHVRLSPSNVVMLGSNLYTYISIQRNTNLPWYSQPSLGNGRARVIRHTTSLSLLRSISTLVCMVWLQIANHVLASFLVGREGQSITYTEVKGCFILPFLYLLCFLVSETLEFLVRVNILTCNQFGINYSVIINMLEGALPTMKCLHAWEIFIGKCCGDS